MKPLISMFYEYVSKLRLDAAEIKTKITQPDKLKRDWLITENTSLLFFFLKMRKNILK